MIQYSLEVAICWSVLYLIYICFLKKETFFSINRVYLLSSLVIGLVIPFLRLIDWHWHDDVVLYDPLQFIAAGPHYIAASISVEPIHETSSWSILNIFLALYWIGVLFMMARLVKGINKIYSLYKEGQKTRKEGFTLVETNHLHLPFSFLNYVFFSKVLAIDEEVRYIIKHELTHIKNRHSYDVFFVEILHVLFWWNPLIYVYKKELRQLHEYLADAMVLTDTNHKIYGQILLGQSESGLEIALTHQFFNSHLKQRIMMMYKQKSKRPAMIKYLLALPVIFSLCIIFSFSTKKSGQYPNEKLKTELDEFFSTESVYFLNSAIFISTYKDLIIRYTDDVEYIQKRFQEAALLSKLKFKFPSDQDDRLCLYKKDVPIEAVGSDIIQINSTDTLPHSARNVNGDKIKTKLDDAILKVAEIMPRFPGCEDLDSTDEEKRLCANDKLLKFIYQNVLYPEEARKKGIEGTVVVQFVIKADGTITDIHLARDIGGGAGEAAKQVVELMTKQNKIWTPGIQNGEEVSILYTLPIKFKLQGTKDTGSRDDVKKPESKIINQVVVVGLGEQSQVNQDSDKAHYIIYAINDCDDSKVNKAKKAIVDYHNTFFNSSGLKVSSLVLNEEDKVHVILVRKFQNINTAIAYTKNASQNINSYLNQRQFDFDMFVVTQNEYREIVGLKSINKRGKIHFGNSQKSPIYKFIDPLRKQFQGSLPLTIVNGNKYEAYSVNLNQINISEDQIKTVKYLEPSAAKNKYGEIAFHGALEIELSDITEYELEKIGKIIKPGSQVLPIAAREEVFKNVEQMPRFPDCEDKCIGVNSIEECHKQELLSFIYTHLNYPKEAKNAGIEGMSVVQFVIDKTGTVIEPNVVRDIGGGTAKEVLYVVELMNNLTKKWTPAYKDGEAVNFLYTLPIRFKLAESKSSEIVEHNVKGLETNTQQKTNEHPLSKENNLLISNTNDQDLPGKTNIAELKQNRPNPVIDQTVIEIKLPASSTGTFSVVNSIGEKLYERTKVFEKGINTITLHKSDLKEVGIFHYTIEAGDFKSTKSMIVID